MDHVRTQLPYALVVAAVAIVVGYLPSGFGIAPLLCLAVGAAILVTVVRRFGRSP